LSRFVANCIYVGEEGEMLSISQVQSVWLRLLQDEIGPGEVRVQPIEPGYFAVVLSNAQEADRSRDSDFRALSLQIGDLSHTRAVYLDSIPCYGLARSESLRAWAGEAAATVESGARRAFAVVDMAKFTGSLRVALEGRGWRTEERGEDLRVCNGHFCAQVNVLREVVRMVLGREDFTAAAQRVAGAAAVQFARDGEFFSRFERRFAGFSPATLDHFFVAYPEQSCAAVGWDYWQLTECSGDEAEKVFEQGMNEIELLLQTAREDGLPGPSIAACGRVHQGK
jgi:hypothetical protein